MVAINPIKLIGEWSEGYALDKHIKSSVYLGEDAFGHKQFKNDYTEIGELLYRLKYNGHHDTSEQILTMAIPFLDEWFEKIHVDIILPVPPTKQRDIQPVYILAELIASYYSIPYSNQVLSNENLKQMKDGKSQPQIKLLKPAKRECNILLVDDIYSTGATLMGCTKALRSDSKISGIYVLTITQTGTSK